MRREEEERTELSAGYRIQKVFPIFAILKYTAENNTEIINILSCKNTDLNC